MTITSDTLHTMCHAALYIHCMCRDDSLRWLPLCRPPILKCFDRRLDNNNIATLDASSFSGLSSLQELFVWPSCRMHDTRYVRVDSIRADARHIITFVCHACRMLYGRHVYVW